MQFNKYIVPVLLVIFMLPAINTTAQVPLSLEDAIRKGLENNYQIRISNMNVEIAENNNTWGMAGRYPVLTLGASQRNRYDDMPSNTDGRNKYYSNNLSPYLNLNWVLFDGMSVNITKDQFELLEQFSEGNAGVVVENTIQGIILAYYMILLEQEKSDVLQELMKLSRDRYNYTMTKKEIGSAVTYDVLQSKDAYLSDSSNYLVQELNLKNAWLNFRLLLGEKDNIYYELTDPFVFDIINYDLNDLIDKMLSSNKTLRNQYINQEILRKETGFQKSAFYPSLTVNAGADHSNNRTRYVGNDASYSYNFDYYANFSLSYNLWNGGRVKTAVQNAKIDEIIGNLSIAEMEHSLTNQLINYYELYDIKQQLFNVTLVSVESAQLNLEISGEKFRSGAINSFNYRDVQLVYLKAALTKLEVTFQLIDTHTELLRLTGGIVTEF